MMIGRICSGLISYASFYGGYGKLKLRWKTKRQREEANPKVRARYCCSVFLRHIDKINEQNLFKNIQSGTIAELGPGTTLGVGLAALIAGFDKYYALDVYNRTDREYNQKLLTEVVKYFKQRDPIPGLDEFPRIHPTIKSNEFPEALIGEHVDGRLQDASIAIKNDINNMEVNSGNRGSRIEQFVPWLDESIIVKDSVDLIMSQAVLEHVEDIRSVYKACYSWLKPNGVMSHDIDFKSHGTADLWNGHWEYNNFVWPIIKKKRPYLITNRLPMSAHVSAMIDAGFRIIEIIPVHDDTGISRSKLASNFKNLSDEDLNTSAAYILAVKDA